MTAPGNRYCESCAALLAPGAVICGECGTRYAPSPYERHGTRTPGAWTDAPRPRESDGSGRDREDEGPAEGIELLGRGTGPAPAPDSTTLRPQDQYDRAMDEQGPPPVPGLASAPGAPSTQAAPGIGTLDAPLDGCAPSTAGKRLVAAIVDSVIHGIVAIPLMIGSILLVAQQEATLLAQILIGIGVALPTAYVVVLLWLQGAKGFTPGKLIAGLRTVRLSTGKPIGFLRALGRAVVYGVFPLLMALSLFLDPRKLLRGFHDRAIDSVVVDVKSGRDPFQPRPDDFQRPGTEHYMPSSSVPVTAHENLMAQPGSAWSADPSTSGASADSAAPAPSGWDPAQPTPSAWDPAGPYGSASSSASQAGSAPSVPPAPAQEPAPAWGAAPAPSPAQPADPWAPAPSAPVEESAPAPAPAPQAAADPAHDAWSSGAPAAQDAWSTPAPTAGQGSAPQEAPPAQAAWSSPAPAAQDAWSTPAPPAAPQDAWGSPAPAAPQDAWGTPAAPAPPQQDAWTAAPSAPAASAPSAPADPVAEETTGGPWDEVDDRTRAFATDDVEEDLEATRLSVIPPAPVRRGITLRMDDGAELRSERTVVVGRNPAAGDQEKPFVIKDDTRSVSKTHLRVDGTGDDVVVTDLGSTNGSAIVHPDGTREGLVQDTATVLPVGAQIAIGDRVLTVERDQ